MKISELFIPDPLRFTREEFKEIEKEANNFASAFLLPKDAFKKDLIYPNKLEVMLN